MASPIEIGPGVKRVTELPTVEPSVRMVAEASRNGLFDANGNTNGSRLEKRQDSLYHGGSRITDRFSM